MKKKLSILLAFAMLMTMFTGCGMVQISLGGGKVEELDAAYQLMDVSGYEYFNLVVGTQKGSRVELSEGDAKLENVYSYEELGAYFTKVDVKSADIVNLFKMTNDGEIDDDSYYGIKLRLKEKYYTSSTIEMIIKVDGETYSGYYGQLWEDDAIAAIPKESYKEDLLNSTEFANTTYMYQFNPSDELFTNSDGKQVIYVATECENSLGKYTLIEEYENTPMEITYMLYVMNERNLIKADGSLKGSETETPETEAPETDAPEDSEETQPSEPETPAEPTWSQPFMGKYFVGDEVYADSSKIGVYMDETYLYVKSDSFGVVEPVALIYEERAEGVYFISEYYEDGYYYYVETGELKRINSYDGSTLATLYVSDKATYEAIGN